jgi:hypothetical protein
MVSASISVQPARFAGKNRFYLFHQQFSVRAPQTGRYDSLPIIKKDNDVFPKNRSIKRINRQIVPIFYPLTFISLPILLEKMIM